MYIGCMIHTLIHVAMSLMLSHSIIQGERKIEKLFPISRVPSLTRVFGVLECVCSTKFGTFFTSNLLVLGLGMYILQLVGHISKL